MKSRHYSIILVAALLIAPPASGQEAEPQTRAEELRRAREDKAANVEPPDRPALERLLRDLETGRLFERLLNPAEGLYPKIGTITPGGGFAVGPAYRTPARLGGHVDFSAFAAASVKEYWMIEGRMRMPRLANERVSVDIAAQRYDFPEEDFFGLGPESNRDDHVTFGLRNTVFTGGVAYAPIRWFSIGAEAGYLKPEIPTYSDREGTILTRFGDSTAPGLEEQPEFARFETRADVNYSEPRGNPREGGRYQIAYQRYRDLDAGDYSFQRVEADLQQYISLLRNRRVLVLRAFASTSDADGGARVPFYLQRTLGGPDDLRGFRRFRFRDNHVLLLQAEYRWEIFTAMDGAIFYDAGKVASRLEDLDLSDLESDYGIGFRFGTSNGVFLRIEGAFGSSGGKHFIFRFGNVF